ncbi:hypothetical protein ACUOFC_60640, partial [Escherichia sp. TWPC-MK]
INRDLTCISGMFTALIEAELFFGEHPIRGTKRLKEEKPDTGYLTQEEIALLLAALDGDNKMIADNKRAASPQRAPVLRQRIAIFL